MNHCAKIQRSADMGLILLMVIGIGLSVAYWVSRISIQRSTKPLQLLAKSADEVDRAIQTAYISPKALIDRMTQTVHTFVGNTEQSDDLTMMAIQR